MNKPLGPILADLRKKNGLSQIDLAAQLNRRGIHVTNQAISKWEKGLCCPDAYQFLTLCEILGAESLLSDFGDSGSSLLRELNDEGARKVREYADVLRASGMYREAEEETPPPVRILPLYVLPVSAGTGQFLDGSDFESVLVGADVPDVADYGVRVAGNSMEPTYCDGQTVWVQSRRTLHTGEVGIFLYDGEAYLKQLYVDETGIRLHSFNPDYPDIAVRSPSELRVLGKAVS